jgi:hypothetical protein
MAVGPVEMSWALVPDMQPSVSVRLGELKKIVADWQGPGALVLANAAQASFESPAAKPGVMVSETATTQGAT